MLAWFPENRLIVMIVWPCSTPSVPSLHFQQKAGQKGMTNQSEREARTWPYDHQGRHKSAEYPCIMCCRNRLPEVGEDITKTQKWFTTLATLARDHLHLYIVVMSFHISLVLRPPLLILHSILWVQFEEWKIGVNTNRKWKKNKWGRPQIKATTGSCIILHD